MNTQEMIKVMQAYVNGEKIEWRSVGASRPPDWIETKVPLWNWSHYEYRIAPKKVMIRHAVCGETILVFTKNYSELETNAAADAEKDPDLIWLDDWHEASFGPINSNV